MACAPTAAVRNAIDATSAVRPATPRTVETVASAERRNARKANEASIAAMNANSATREQGPGRLRELLRAHGVPTRSGTWGPPAAAITAATAASNSVSYCVLRCKANPPTISRDPSPAGSARTQSLRREV